MEHSSQAQSRQPAVHSAALWLLLLTATAAADDSVDFTRDVRPLLSDACFECHGPDAEKRQGHLRLDQEQDVRRTGVIVPGNAATSKLYRRLTSTDPDLRMPPPASGKTLDDDDVKRIGRWIDAGAPWRQHWSFIPPSRPAPPDVKRRDWPRSALDSFVLARIESAGLEPSPPAPSATLLRRATLDLTGIPPTTAELDAFAADGRPEAYERAVDRLLASPRFGERLAERWLDAARYADTNGYQTDGIRHMWRWRDWVIDAYNSGLPFDEFTVEQIAGDLLPNASIEQRIATGFNRNHRGNAEGGIIPEEYRVEYVVDRVDTTATVWLGLTLACARCHDHKYDPFSQEEFYQVFAYFNNVPERGKAFKIGNAIPIMAAPTEEQRIELDALKAQIEAQHTRFLAMDLQGELKRWERNSPPTRSEWTIERGLFLDVSFNESAVTAAAEVSPGAVSQVVTAAAGRVVPGRSEPVRLTQGTYGEALNLDGESYFELGDTAAFSFFDSFSIALQVFVRGPGEAGLVSRMDDSFTSTGYSLHLKDERVQAAFVRRWLDDALRVETTTSLELGRWHHITLTYNGSRTADGIKIYVDGEAQPLRYLVDDLNQEFTTDAPLRLGSRGTEHRLDGLLDEVRFYRRALDGEEVRVLSHDQTIGEILATPADSRSPRAVAKLRAFFLAEGGPDPLKEAYSEWQKLRGDYATRVSALPTTMVMQELTEPRATHLLVRGAYDNPGQRVLPKVPSALAPLPAGVTNDRLGFARWLVARENPLTARVTVNRYWQMLFGQGLVRTVEDFGSQGELPSHPGLLDWLAVEFMTMGWDTKALLKTILTSAVYRQDSRVGSELLERDPENRLLARGPRFRLDAAVIRDQALAASGLLVEALGGPSVRPYQPAGIWKEVSGNEYQSDTGQGLYRRSLYTFWKRTVAPPAMMVFDASPRETCVVRQVRTNTPLQALNLMNDVTYVEAARALAQDLLHDTGRENNAGTPDDPGRLTRAFRTLTSRSPSPQELSILESALRAHRERFHRLPDAANALITLGETPPDAKLSSVELAAYTTVVGMILNLDETVTKE